MYLNIKTQCAQSDCLSLELFPYQAAKLSRTQAVDSGGMYHARGQGARYAVRMNGWEEGEGAETKQIAGLATGGEKRGRSRMAVITLLIKVWLLIINGWPVWEIEV